jgi:hypothetical protein
MLKAGIFILTFLSCYLCHAQNDSIGKISDSKYNLKLAYLSTLIYPGASIGIEFPLQKLNAGMVEKHKKNRSVYKSRFISGNVNWYHHPDFHDNLYVTAEWVMRRTNSNGLISEFSGGPGFSRTFLGGTTYRVNESGDIAIVRLAGYKYALLTIGYGLGIDFSVKKKIPYSAVIKMNLISMFPYNSTIYIRPVLEIGLRYSPWKCKTRPTNE